MLMRTSHQVLMCILMKFDNVLLTSFFFELSISLLFFICSLFFSQVLVMKADPFRLPLRLLQTTQIPSSLCFLPPPVRSSFLLFMETRRIHLHSSLQVSFSHGHIQFTSNLFSFRGIRKLHVEIYYEFVYLIYMQVFY